MMKKTLKITIGGAVLGSMMMLGACGSAEAVPQKIEQGEIETYPSHVQDGDISMEYFDHVKKFAKSLSDLNSEIDLLMDKEKYEEALPAIQRKDDLIYEYEDLDITANTSVEKEISEIIEQKIVFEKVFSRMEKGIASNSRGISPDISIVDESMEAHKKYLEILKKYDLK